MRQPSFFMAFDYDNTGNLALPDHRKVAFFASRVVSPTAEKQALCWAEACCATFDLLLKARHPVIWGLGRTLCHRYSPEIQAALAEQHILLIFAERNTCRTNWQTVQTRNFQIASMSNESVYAMNIEGRSSSLDVLYDLETKIKAKTVFLFKTP